MTGTIRGIDRLWRDGGFAVGGLLSVLIADAYLIPVATAAVAALTGLSGIIVAVRMRSTDHRVRVGQPAGLSRVVCCSR